jgi:hypothetical protein
MDAHDLHLEIDYPNEKAGWIHCFLTFDGLTHRFDASSSLPPFQKLLDFLRSIVLQRLPAWFYWDEEGYGAYFEAWPIADTDGDSPDFHLRVIHEDRDYHWIGEGEERKALVNTYNVLWVDADLGREAVVEVLLAPLRDFILYSQQPHNWEVALADLQAFEQLRVQGIPPRSEPTGARPFDLIIKRWQDEDDQYGTQYFELRMWDMRVMGWNLDDTDAFWPLWFELLEHALTGRPFEMVCIDTFGLRINRGFVADGAESPAGDDPDWSTSIVILPLDHQDAPSRPSMRRVRMKIFETDDRYTDFLRVDEIVDAVLLARMFLKEFEHLLADGYKPYPDEEGNLFDLRQLPVAHLKETLARQDGELK